MCPNCHARIGYFGFTRYAPSVSDKKWYQYNTSIIICKKCNSEIEVINKNYWLTILSYILFISPFILISINNELINNKFIFLTLYIPAVTLKLIANRGIKYKLKGSLS